MTSQPSLLEEVLSIQVLQKEREECIRRIAAIETDPTATATSIVMDKHVLTQHRMRLQVEIDNRIDRWILGNRL